MNMKNKSANLSNNDELLLAIWYVAKEIRKEQHITQSNEPVEFIYQNEQSAPSTNDQERALDYLEQEEVIEIVGTVKPIRTSIAQMFNTLDLLTGKKKSPDETIGYKVNVKGAFIEIYEKIKKKVATAADPQELTKIKKMTFVKIDGRDACKIVLNQDISNPIKVNTKKGGTFWKLLQAAGDENIDSDNNTHHYLNNREDNALYNNSSFPPQKIVESVNGRMTIIPETEMINEAILKEREKRGY
jgi:hypothetical protein